MQAALRQRMVPIRQSKRSPCTLVQMKRITDRTLMHAHGSPLFEFDVHSGPKLDKWVLAVMRSGKCFYSMLFEADLTGDLLSAREKYQISSQYQISGLPLADPLI